MTIAHRLVCSPLIWIIILFILGNPVIASQVETPTAGAEAQQGAREVDFTPLVTMARVAGTCSIAVALVWSTGLVLSARIRHQEGRVKSCGRH